MMNQNSTALKAGEIPKAGGEYVDSKSMLERQLMDRVLNGETDLFYELIRPYERAVFFAATSILGNEADAEEVAQEAVL